MWVPVLGVVCVGLFVGAAVAQFKQHHKQHTDDADAPAPVDGPRREPPDDTESE
jgi:hypothetical protein